MTDADARLSEIRPSPKQAEDAKRLIQRLIGPCDGDPDDDHEWRKCRRCLATHALQTRATFTVNLLRDVSFLLDRVIQQEHQIGELTKALIAYEAQVVALTAERDDSNKIAAQWRDRLAASIVEVSRLSALLQTAQEQTKL